MKTDGQVSLYQDVELFGYIPRSSKSGLYCNHIYSFLRTSILIIIVDTHVFTPNTLNKGTFFPHVIP